MRNRNLFWYLGKKIEKLLLRLVILCSVVMVLTQAFYTQDPSSRAIGYVDLEEVMAPPQQQGTGPAITLYLKEYPSLPKMHVLVNGEPAASFNSRYVTLQVDREDDITLDASFYDLAVEVEVVHITEEVVSPAKGKTVTVEGITQLGKVQLKAP